MAEWNRAMRSCEGLWTVGVGELSVAEVLGVAKGLTGTPAVLHFVLSVIRRVVDREVALGNRSEDRINPADWSRLGKVFPVKWEKGHHAAMPYTEVPAFVRGLREKESAAARALELLILTGLRKSELLGLRWDWIDWEKCVLTIPAVAMKGGKRSHVVPLTRRAIEILRQCQTHTGGSGGAIGQTRGESPPAGRDPIRGIVEGAYVFPGERRVKIVDGRKVIEGGETMHVTALKIGALGLAAAGATAHGFRSSSRDYLAEQTDVQGWVAEGVLAHTVAGVEGAYRRGNAIEKRGRALKLWADFIG